MKFTNLEIELLLRAVNTIETENDRDTFFFSESGQTIKSLLTDLWIEKNNVISESDAARMSYTMEYEEAAKILYDFYITRGFYQIKLLQNRKGEDLEEFLEPILYS